MKQQNNKYIGKRPIQKPVTKMDTLRDTWTVMKPFVHFSYKALKVVAHALIFIVKHIPKPEEHNSKNQKTDKMIKI